MYDSHEVQLFGVPAHVLQVLSHSTQAFPTKTEMLGGQVARQLLWNM